MSDLKEGDKFTLKHWLNMKIIEKKVRKDGGFDIVGELLPDDKDFKKTKKVCWLPFKKELLVSLDSSY